MKLHKIILNKYGDEEPIIINPGSLVFIEKEAMIHANDSTVLVHVRTEGDFKGKAIRLNSDFGWEWGLDSDGALMIVPIKE